MKHVETLLNQFNVQMSCTGEKKSKWTGIGKRFGKKDMILHQGFRVLWSYKRSEILNGGKVQKLHRPGTFVTFFG